MPMPPRDDPDPFDAAPLSPSLRALARRGVLKRLRRGVQIISEGDVGDTIFIILSGQLRAYSVSADFREITYAEYGAGDMVGEMGLDGGPRSANVDTKEPSVCAVVTRATLRQYLAEDPDFAFELLAIVIRRARVATQSLRQVALHSVYTRLKPLLEGWAVKQPDGSALIDPAPSHLDISRQMACDRAMISRVLKDLERGGYVLVGRRRLAILKPLPLRW
jgi:CRP/FNR family cyclic AMP-dependent transcriptional regulator